MFIQEFFDTTDYGGYLVPLVTHAHQGDNLDIFYYSGGMLSSAENLSVYAITPEGKKQYLNMTNSGEGRAYRIQINENGIYQFVAEQTRYISRDAEGRCFSGTFEDNPDAVFAARCLHYAHSALQSGASFEFSNCAKTLMPPLCIAPDIWSSFRVGDVLGFTLVFLDRPLPLYDIDIYLFSIDGEVIHTKRITNGDGRALLPLNKLGKYIIDASYTSPEYKEGLYYDTRYTYSFCFKARA